MAKLGDPNYGRRKVALKPETVKKNEYEVVTPLASDVCPTCGQIRKCKPLTNAERQRRYRERRKRNAETEET